MQLFHLYWYHFLKKYSRNPFSHFLLRFFAFPDLHAEGVCQIAQRRSATFSPQMSAAGERESYEALRSSYIHLLSFFDTSAAQLGKKESPFGLSFCSLSDASWRSRPCRWRTGQPSRRRCRCPHRRFWANPWCRRSWCRW